MGHVVAFIDQETCRTYRDRSDAPAGSLVFASSEELGAALSTKSMDLVRGKLLGQIVEPSPSCGAAAARLWHVLSLGAELVRVDWSAKGYATQKDRFGNRKNPVARPGDSL